MKLKTGDKMYTIHDNQIDMVLVSNTHQDQSIVLSLYNWNTYVQPVQLLFERASEALCHLRSTQ